MTYQISNLSRALILASKAHAGQIDKSGEPYILHPLRVAFHYGLQTEEEQIVGLLHDVIEDTPITYSEIFSQFGREIADAVVSVSRGYIDSATGTMAFKPAPGLEKEVYIDFVRRAKLNLIGRKVKKADLQDNLSPARMSHLPESEHGMTKRYEKAMKILEEA